MSWSSQKKKKGIFCTIYFVQRNFFFLIFVSSQCIVYWIHFQNINTFTYQKTLLHTLFLLVFIIVRSLQRILNLVCLRFCLLVNIAQSYLIFHFRINCMLSLVILSFPCLILVFSWLVVAISYSWFYSVNLGLFLG